MQISCRLSGLKKKKRRTHLCGPFQRASEIASRKQTETAHESGSSMFLYLYTTLVKVVVLMEYFHCVVQVAINTVPGGSILHSKSYRHETRACIECSAMCLSPTPPPPPHPHTQHIGGEEEDEEDEVMRARGG